MNTFRCVLKNTVSLASAELITKFITFILTIYIARYLQEVSFGKYSFALAFTCFFAIIPDLGLNTFTIREVAKNKELASKYLGNISIVKFILSICGLIILIIIINLMHYPSDTTLAVYIFGAYVMINNLNQFFVSIYRAFDKMEYEMFVRIIESIVLFSLTMYAIYFQYGLIEIVYAMFLSSVFRLILSGILIVKNFRRPKLEFDFNFVKDVIKEALPFGLTAVFVVIYFRIDTVMLSIMKGDAAVGWYNVAFNIVHGLCALIIGSITGVCLPLMSRHLESLNDLKKIYIHSFEILFFLGLLISIIITIYSTELIQVIYGVGYSSSSIILKILIWSFFMMGISSISSTLLYSINKQRIVTVGTGIGALLNVILNLILIPKYSYIGAASATVVTEVVGFIIYFYYSIRFLNIGIRDRSIFIWTIKEMSKNLNYKILK